MAAHGGKRAGSGQPRKGKPYVTFSISMRPEMRDIIDRAAKRAGVTVSRWLVTLAREEITTEYMLNEDPEGLNETETVI